VGATRGRWHEAGQLVRCRDSALTVNGRSTRSYGGSSDEDKCDVQDAADELNVREQNARLFDTARRPHPKCDDKPDERNRGEWDQVDPRR